MQSMLALAGGDCGEEFVAHVDLSLKPLARMLIVTVAIFASTCA